MTFKLYAVRVFCTKWNEALAFYRDKVGLPVYFESEEQGWAQFDLGGVYLGLERCDRDDPETRDLVGRFVGTSIMVDDIDAVYAQLTDRGVEFLGPPERQSWGGVLLHLKDPDGNVITLLGGS